MLVLSPTSKFNNVMIYKKMITPVKTSVVGDNTNNGPELIYDL